MQITGLTGNLALKLYAGAADLGRAVNAVLELQTKAAVQPAASGGHTGQSGKGMKLDLVV